MRQLLCLLVKLELGQDFRVYGKVTVWYNGPMEPQKQMKPGLFGVSEDFSQKAQSLNERFVKNITSSYFFLLDGESMSPTLNQGDILLVDRSVRDHHGRVCLVEFEGDIICRRVIILDDRVVLRADNPEFKEISLTEGQVLVVWGVVTSRHSEVF